MNKNMRYLISFLLSQIIVFGVFFIPIKYNIKNYKNANAFSPVQIILNEKKTQTKSITKENNILPKNKIESTINKTSLEEPYFFSDLSNENLKKSNQNFVNMNQKEINIQDSVDEVNLNKSYGVVQNFAIDFLKTKINENLFYPVRAKQRKISGTVELKIAVDENGLLKLCKIHKTSDSLILDNAATELVQNIFPIDKNFSDLPFEKIILIEYKLN